MSISTLGSSGVELDSDENVLGLHAELRYDDVERAGPAARPLDFPAPTVHRCQNIHVHARDHRSGTIHYLKSVLVRTDYTERAYFVTKKLSRTVFGTIRLCVVLKRLHPILDDNMEERQDSSLHHPQIEWESTDLQVAVKISEFSKIHAMRGRHLEDPIKEISAMQLLGNYHPNVLGSFEVLQDDNFLYTITRCLSGGELYGRLQEGFPRRRSSDNDLDEFEGYAYDESRARTWFKQLVMALDHYHKKGVAHMDVSLDNLVLDSKNRVVLVDPGLSLRVPHSDPCNPDCVSDVSAGTSRRLIITQGQGGKLNYAAPEIVEKKQTVDAYAVDLWAAGVVLFIMLVGLAPFKWANSSDKRFAKISRGGLSELVAALDIPLSPEAIDLLQGFFYRDPRQRWNLAEIMQHPWVQGKQLRNGGYAAGRFSFPLQGPAKSLPANKHLRGMPQKIQPNTHLAVPHNSYYC